MFHILRVLIITSALVFAGESGWNTAWTPHFIFHKENSGGKGKVEANFEKIFRVLRKDMWQLSSWMDTEKVEVYIYKNRKSYIKGQFKPPKWSAAMVRYSSRPGSTWLLAIFEPLNNRSIAHELTHLYFKSFFGNNSHRIPLWLNEGLAEMMANKAVKNERRSSRAIFIKKTIPIANFLKMKRIPNHRVRDFYSQAHSIALFLKKANSPFKFTTFCRQLRDGEKVERALLSAYGFRTAAEFEKAWKKWAGIKTGKRKRARGSLKKTAI